MNRDRVGYLIFRHDNELRKREVKCLKEFRDDLTEWKEFKTNKTNS